MFTQDLKEKETELNCLKKYQNRKDPTIRRQKWEETEPAEMGMGK